MPVTVKQQLKRSNWPQQQVEGFGKLRKILALSSLECPGILVSHFGHYLEENAIL
jgi:hypothetical protein